MSSVAPDRPRKTTVRTIQARRDRGAEGRVRFNNRGLEPRLGVEQQHLPGPVDIRGGRGSSPCGELAHEGAEDDAEQSHGGTLARRGSRCKIPQALERRGA